VLDNNLLHAVGSIAHNVPSAYGVLNFGFCPNERRKQAQGLFAIDGDTARFCQTGIAIQRA
jgi:hypothetical protein